MNEARELCKFSAMQATLQYQYFKRKESITMPRMRFTYNLWGADAEDAAVRAEEHDHSAVSSRLRRHHPEPTSTKKGRRGRN